MHRSALKQRRPEVKPLTIHGSALTTCLSHSPPESNKLTLTEHKVPFRACLRCRFEVTEPVGAFTKVTLRGITRTPLERSSTTCSYRFMEQYSVHRRVLASMFLVPSPHEVEKPNPRLGPSKNPREAWRHLSTISRFLPISRLGQTLKMDTSHLLIFCH
jgi:hypothetical protein